MQASVSDGIEAKPRDTPTGPTVPASDGPGRGSRARAFFHPLTWRSLAFFIVLLSGVLGLSSGVGFSERSVVGAGWAAHFYYVLGLFVMGGLDLGTPQGGPALGRALLWVAYFLAPAITASALLEAILRVAPPLGLRLRRLDDHVIVAGCGRLSLLYLQRLRETDPHTTVVLVEQNPTQPHLSEARDVYNALIVTGDISSDAVLARLRAGRARRVLLLTGDDFANLDAAAKLLRLAPHLSRRIVIHVADLHFMQRVADTSIARACEAFNVHEFAAAHLVKEYLADYFLETTYPDVVVLAGFGRFGQTVLRRLQQQASCSFGTVVIIDVEADLKAKTFAEEPGFRGDYDPEVINGDIRDPALWETIAGIIGHDDRDPVIIVGSGDDGINLHTALTLIKIYPRAFIVVRSFRHSPFGEGTEPV